MLAMLACPVSTRAHLNYVRSLVWQISIRVTASSWACEFDLNNILANETSARAADKSITAKTRPAAASLGACLLRSPFFLHGVSHTTKLNWNEYISIRPGGPSLVWTNWLKFQSIWSGTIIWFLEEWKVQNKMRPHRPGSLGHRQQTFQLEILCLFV